LSKNNAYVCQSCGSVASKWMGQCSGCSEWNTLVEEQNHQVPKSLKRSKGHLIELSNLEEPVAELPRFKSTISEFDRVCGGGIVPGSVVLIGGDPGIGKSTLLLQVASKLASNGVGVGYISGEEALDQIRLRARRMGVESTPITMASATNITDIIATLKETKNLKVVIIDSIQTMYVDALEAAPGTVSQVRAAAHDLITFAKKSNISVIMIGHVTKEGTLAGPRVLEHMVDAVIYFEGERSHQFRILRGVKNRFGPTDEMGVFTMTDLGLEEVQNPSGLFLADRQEKVSGSCVFAGIEGTRPILVEIQALISPTAYGTPRRAVVGWDSNRLAMIIAVLEARCGLVIGMRDVYLNVVGGLKIQEPAADLAVAAALVSALNDRPLSSDAVFCGEIGLTGEVRAISHMALRIKEAQKLGFNEVYMPQVNQGRLGKSSLENHTVNLRAIGSVGEIIQNFGKLGSGKRISNYG